MTTRLAVNGRHDVADRANMSALTRRWATPTRGADEGFGMVEMMVSLVIIAIVTTAALNFFLNGLSSENGQRQRQEAIYLADQQMQTVQAVPAADLVQGRTSAMQTAALSTPIATTLNLAAQSDTSSGAGFDSNASDSVLIPVSQTQTVNKITFTLWTFVAACHLKVDSNTLCGPTVTAGSTTELRATVAVTWKSHANCSTGCNYSTSTLVDPSGDQTFNTNISAPTGSITTPTPVSPAPAAFFNTNTGTRAGIPYETCTTGPAGNTVTVPGTKMIITGTGFKSNIRVLISSNGGSIPTNTIYQPSATEVDVCLQTGDIPGTYTLSVINNDGGHFQTPLVERPVIRWVALTGSGANQTLTLNGGGYVTGATFAATGGIGGSFTVVSKIQATLSHYVPPSAGLALAPVLTLTDPAPGSQQAFFTLPDMSATTTPSAVAVGKVVNVNVTGTGFQTGLATTLVTNGTAVVSASPAVTPGTATVTIQANAIGTMSFALLNPDGGVSNTISLTVDPLPTVVAPGSKLLGSTWTLAGTGFLPGMTATITGGDGVVVNSITGTTAASLTVSGATSGNFTLTLTNFDGGTVSTPITILPGPKVTGSTVGVSGQKAVILTGTNFLTGVTVTDANGTVNSVTLNSSTQLTVMLSDSATTPVTHNLTVTNPDTGSTTAAVVVDAPPIISTFPASTQVGIPFTVTGTGFAAGITISSTKAGATVSFVNATTVTVTLGTAGAQNWSLTNTDTGFSNLVTSSPILGPAPTITSFTVSPSSPSKSTSPTITVVGTNLTATSTYVTTWVKSGDPTQTPTPTYTSRTTTGAVYTGPLSSRNGTYTVTVTVTNPDGQTATSTPKTVNVQ
jgi:prepilin-type N-terminal cleavage/methylation domain-containing protein